MTKAQLRRYGALKRERAQLEDKIKEIEAALYSPKAQRMTGMPSTPSHGNATEALIAKHLELQELYRAKLAELVEEQLTIEAAIESLDLTARTLLRYRYIDCLKWEEICLRMSYCWRQTHNLHSKALEALKDK